MTKLNDKGCFGYFAIESELCKNCVDRVSCFDKLTERDIPEDKDDRAQQYMDMRIYECNCKTCGKYDCPGQGTTKHKVCLEWIELIPEEIEDSTDQGKKDCSNCGNKLKTLALCFIDGCDDNLSKWKPQEQELVSDQDYVISVEEILKVLNHNSATWIHLMEHDRKRLATELYDLIVGVYGIVPKPDQDKVKEANEYVDRRERWLTEQLEKTTLTTEERGLYLGERIGLSIAQSAYKDGLLNTVELAERIESPDATTPEIKTRSRGFQRRYGSETPEQKKEEGD